jgi:hypothetical protein
MIPGLTYTGEQRVLDGRTYNVALGDGFTVLEPVRDAEEQRAYEARVNVMRDMLAARAAKQGRHKEEGV